VNLPGYRVVAVCEAHGDTLMYNAVRESDGRAVLLKTPRQELPSRRQLAPLRHEYEVTRALDVPGVIRACDFVEHDSRATLVLDGAGGESLKSVLEAARPDLDVVLEVAGALARTLGALHERQIIHKDIRPHNILLDRDTCEVCLTDFGLCSRLSQEEQEVRNPEALHGTLEYMSPEQTGRMNRVVDYRSDYYSLGVTLYEMLTGSVPFAVSDPMELVHCHLARMPVPPHERRPEVPPALSRIVMKLLAKTAEDRYQSARGLQRDLEEIRTRLAQGRLEDFEPGRHDVSPIFQVPQKLYGREAEVRLLMEAFDRVGDGAMETIMVSGYSGIGKSALVHEVHKPIVQRRGYFVSGKFDQFERSVPYSALIGAATDLVRQLLTESAERVADWKEHLLETLGPNGRVISDVIFEVEWIIGEQPPVPELAPSEAQNRFSLVFRRFMHVFARPEHPLALFLDDLQWADSATLKLLRVLLTDSDAQHFFLMGAYRDNEVSGAHPLMHLLEDLKAAGATVREIRLGPLDAEHLLDLVSDALHRPREEARRLSEILLNRTGGNPFFASQMLRTMHRDGLLTLDAERGAWQYDGARIEQMGYTDNVVDQLTREVRKMDEQTRDVLSYAACVGSEFELDTLALAAGRSRAETAAALWPAVREGIILPLSDDYRYLEHDENISVSYRFLHDRVQQAVDSMLSPERKTEMHLTVGRLLLQGTPADDLDEHLFDILSHLNQAVDLVTEPGERRRIAELDLLAGRRAKASAANEAARAHLQIGVRLVKGDAWTTDYPLAFAMHKELAEAEHLCGSDEAADKLFALLRERARTRLDFADVCHIQITAYVTLNRGTEAIRIGLEALRRFGVNLPEKPGQLAIMRELIKTKVNLGWRSPYALVNAPLMKDPDQQAVSALLNNILAPCYQFGNPELMTLAVLRMVNVALKHGNAEPTTFAYVVYGFVLAGALQQYKQGYEFGDVGLKLIEKMNCPAQIPRAYHTFSAFNNPWMKPYQTSHRYAREAFEHGVNFGDIMYAGWSAWDQMGYALTGFDSIDLVDSLYDQYESFLTWTNDKVVSNLTLLARQVGRALQGRTRKLDDLDGDGVDSQESLRAMEETGLKIGPCWYYTARAKLCYLFGDDAGALRWNQEVERSKDGLFATAYLAYHEFFMALVMARLYPTAGPLEQSPYFTKMRAARKNLKNWAANCPENFLAMHHLVAGEIGRVVKDEYEALRRYDLAQAAARESGNVMVEALANELAGRFHAERSRAVVARGYLTVARLQYARWGATGKVALLENEFPDLLAGDAPAQSESGGLDLHTVIKASQAISGEITRRGLLRKLLRFLMENAGAQKVRLLVSRDGALELAALGSLEHEEIPQHGIALHEADVPQAIVHYVEHTRQDLVLEDATADELFRSDEYVAREKPRSVLCVPLLNQSQLAGIVYLENHLAAGAFTPRRLELVRLLSSQAAISLESAGLYDRLEEHSHTLEHKVEERTFELSEQNRRLVELQDRMVTQQKLAYLGTLTAGIAHEIRNPLNFVNNFAELSVDLVKELREAGGSDPETLDLLKQNVDKIYAHGQRAERIVRSMLEHSRAGEGTRAPAQVNAIVSDVVQFAYHGTGSEDVKLDLRLAPDLPDVVVSASDISRVVLNVVNNALYAVSEKAAKAPGFVPGVRVETVRHDGEVQICVHDNGTGIATEHRDQVFNPFFTTKPSGSGTGLGLSISYDIVVRSHQGSLTVDSTPGEFTEFRIGLPVGAEA